MKNSIWGLVLILCTLEAHAVMRCDFRWDSSMYSPAYRNFEPFEIGAKTTEWVTYFKYDMKTNKYVEAYSPVDFEIKKLVELERVSGTCHVGKDYNYAYDNVVFGTFVHASSKEPVFPDPSDGAPHKDVEMWGICAGGIERLCKATKP